MSLVSLNAMAARTGLRYLKPVGPTFSAQVYAHGTTVPVTVYEDPAGTLVIKPPLLFTADLGGHDTVGVQNQVPGWVDDSLDVDLVFATTGGTVTLHLSGAGGSGAEALAPTAVKSSTYTAAPGDFIPVDASGGTVAINLPSAPPDKTRVGVKIVLQAATPNTVTINRGGSDVFNKAGGSTSLTLAATSQALALQYSFATGIWYVQSTDSPLNVASGAAKLGTDGTVGGPGGSSLTGSVGNVSSLVVALGAASGDGTGVTDTAAINAALTSAAILSAGGTGTAIVRAQPGVVYKIAPALTRSVQFPSGSAPSTRNVCIPIPNGVVLDMNGSTLQLQGSTQAVMVSSNTLDASARNHDIGLVNATIDCNSVAFTTYTAAHFAYVDRMVERSVKIINGTSQGMWHWDVTNSTFEDLDSNGFQGQPWVFGDPQPGGYGTNMVYNSNFRGLKGQNVTLFNTGSQPGNPYYMVLKDCDIDVINVNTISAGIKIGQPTDGLTIGRVIIDTCGEGTALNSGFKLQGNPALGAAVSFTGDTTVNGTAIINASSITGLVANSPITGPNIPANTHIVGTPSGSTVNISNPATLTATTQTFNQIEQRYVSNVKVGQVIARNCANLGLYLYWTKNCSVDSYTGVNNVLLHTANCDVYMDGGINDYVGSIKSILSNGGGVRITASATNYPTGYRLPNVLVLNCGQNASNAIKNGVRVEGATSLGTLGDVVCLDNQTSHTMDVGANILNAGAAGAISTLSVSGNTGSATVNNAPTTFTLPSAGATVIPVDVQTLTGSGTYTRPSAGQTTCRVLVIGNGGGGGAGARGPTSTARVGGGGGGGGGMTEREFPIASLTSTVSVVFGATGTGAPAQTVDGSAGANGTAGGSVQFGAFVRANGGSAGTGGGLVGAGGTAGAGGSALFPGLAGGAGSATGAAGALGATGATPGGGGAGGGISSGNTDNAGGQGSPTTGGGGLAGTAGTASGGNGGDGGNAASNSDSPGGGGGGGGGSSVGAAGHGGAGGLYGAGGGGGGASLNGNNSGAGGTGGGGICIAISR